MAAIAESLPASGAHSPDEGWFARLYEETFSSTYRFAQMLTRDREVAADVVADVYLRAWMRRKDLMATPNPRAWLLTVARNRVADEFRARRHMVDLDSVSEPEAPDPAEGERELTPAERSFIRSQIHRLTPEQQQVIFLRFYRHLSHEEVARELQRTPNAVRAIQFRAIARLRRLLKEAPRAI